MIKATQFRTGMVLIYEGEPHRVTFFKHTVTGRGSASIPVKMKNILNGQAVEKTFRSDDKLEKAYIEEKEMEYLYEDGGEFWFMDTATYEQIAVQKADIEDIIGYLKPNTQCRVQFYEGKTIGVTPPTTVQLKVTDTEPSIKGATASGNVTKPATLETGLVIQVPMFVEKDDTLIVNTESGEYQGRPREK